MTNKLRYFEEIVVECLIKEFQHSSEEAKNIYDDYFGIRMCIQGATPLKIAEIYHNAFTKSLKGKDWEIHVQENEKRFYELDGKSISLPLELQKERFEQGKQIRYEEMGYFDQEVIRDMVMVYRHSIEEAVQIFNEYIPIILYLDVKNSTPLDFAELIVQLKEMKITPEKSKEFVEKLIKNGALPQ